MFPVVVDTQTQILLVREHTERLRETLAPAGEGHRVAA